MGDGDTIEVNNVPIRLAALDCPDRGTKNGDYEQGWQNSFRAYRLPVSLHELKHMTAWSDTVKLMMQTLERT